MSENPYPENIYESAHLKLFGWFERGKDTFVECKKHGMVKAYVHGWKEKIECPICFKEERNNE